MKRTILFVPGFRENINSREYDMVLQVMRRSGYCVEFVDITWKKTTIDNQDEQLEQAYRKYNAKDAVLAGFSFGAIVAFVASAKKLPSELWLFSLSPFFAEDLQNLKKWELTKLGARRVEAAGKTSFNELATRVTCPVKIFVGSRELSMWPEMSYRFGEASARLVNVSPIIVENVGHTIEDSGYRNSIAQAIGRTR